MQAEGATLVGYMSARRILADVESSHVRLTYTRSKVEMHFGLDIFSSNSYLFPTTIPITRCRTFLDINSCF